jgi:TraX protein
VRHDALEAAKWIALITMTIDHYGKIVDPSVFLVTHCIGRVSFPLFAGIVGLRLALAPALAGSYLKRLTFWAVVSQPVFVLAGRPWSDGNILFTLLLGVAANSAILLLRRDRDAGGILLLVLIAAAASYAEFGIAGVAMVPLVARIASARPSTALWLIGPIGVLANLVFEFPPLVAADLFALGATPVAVASARLPGSVPRLPKYFFYAYYPAHLYALHWIDLHVS